MNIKSNIIANYLGRGWTALLSLAFVPFYIKFLGAEAYGLFGIYLAMLGLFAVLDLGLSTALNRILAQHSAYDIEPNQVHNLVRTFEICYWIAGAVIGIFVFLSAPWLAAHWINEKGLPETTVISVLRLMGGVIVFQWPVALYSGGLMGLQRQVLLNGIRSGTATIQGGGAVLVLWLLSATVQAFFIWQLLASILQVFLLKKYLSNSLPPFEQQPRFEMKWLLHNWRFTAGTLGITLLATILTQLDKVILSKWLSLAAFGYYTLAITVSNALASLASPVFSAAFPRFSQLYAENRTMKLAEIYHKTSRLLSMFIVPIGVTLAFFSGEILSLWIHDDEVVKNVSPVLSVMVLGTVLNSIMSMPLALQFAGGWTKLSFYKNIVAVVIFVPMLVTLISNYGALGAAIGWVILNVGYIVIEPLIMHRRMLPSEMTRWYVNDVGLYVLVSTTIGGVFWYVESYLPYHSMLFVLSLTMTWAILMAGFRKEIKALLSNGIKGDEPQIKGTNYGN